ncbi:FecR family protein [Sphingobacterium detergens]|uniref:FecR family protein n=1 Tax=Sphingobacterium detergens TaxID=1145106 RepID=A0A420AY36_SPHD1|nr:FecR family protein [Sphingobacterium detergens]RKE49280.1 FecR family protein [Sphingobacterium detergens]
MKENAGHIANLIHKFLCDQLTEEEKLRFDEWLRASAQNKQLLASFQKAQNIEEDLVILRQLDANKAWNQLNNKSGNTKSNGKWLIGIAASLLLVMGLVYIWYNNLLIKDTSEQKQTIAVGRDIAPAKSGAILRMANGDEFLLNNTTAKALDNNKTLMASDLELIVKNSGSYAEDHLNSLVVPRASFYKLTLSDGTKVWINAQSNLTFPAQFPDNERRVALEGEAYFEVAHDAKRPFFVASKAGEIKVLGTHFNVFAYHDNIRTTLVEGKVEVRQKENKLELIPGEFASLSKNNLVKGKADIQQDLAWHNNEFYFKKETIVNIAHQLSRWYDLEVKFRGDVQLTKEYSGSIQRDVQLSQVLEMLSYVSDLRFEIHGKELIIENKN